ncbi:MAG: DMP19 family protein [bacterium]|nr:DMP19 family protein [bacterium]
MDNTIQAGWATYERLATADRAELNGFEIGLVAVGSLRTQVNNGGFHQYLFNSSGDLAESARGWALRKNAPGLADVIDQAMALVDVPYPTDWQERQQQLVGVADEAFEALDRRYRMLEVALDLDVVLDDLAEASFWTVLQRRIVSELRESGRSEFSGFWCDGIGPDSYRLSSARPTISGSVHLGQSGQEPWEFTLAPGIDNAMRAIRERLWEPLLPANDSTGWLAANTETRTIAIDLTRSEPLGEPVEVHPKTGRIKPAKRPSRGPTG